MIEPEDRNPTENAEEDVAAVDDDVDSNDEDDESDDDRVGENTRDPAFIDPVSGIVRFPSPPMHTSASALLVSDIVDLDHRSLRRLGKDSADRAEVAGLLRNAAGTTSIGDLKTGRILCDRARATYDAIVESQNRVTYLSGVLLGLIPAALVATVVTVSLRIAMPRLTSLSLIVLICLFAALGSLTSVLTRLTSIDLSQEASRRLLLVSGTARPAVAVSFAVAVFLILRSQLVDIHLGSDPTGVGDAGALAVSFVVGFSERFAKDLIARVAGD